LLTRRRRGILLAIAAVSCGGSTSSSQTYNVPVRLNDGNISHPIGIAVTIN
jgi:hypothetical protein